MKYKLTDKTTTHNGRALYRIQALRDIPRFDVKVGDLGGWIEKEDNLSQDGDAQVYGDARVCGDAQVYGDAWVYGNAQVYGDAWVYGDALVYGDAQIENTRDYITIGPIGSRDATLTVTFKPELKVTRGCFHNTLEAFEAAVRENHTGLHLDEYLTTIQYINIIKEKRK